LRSGNLIKKRLKLVVVEFVDEENAELSVIERLDKTETGKTPSDYDYVFHTYADFRWLRN
jgi:hypothetical protein